MRREWYLYDRANDVVITGYATEEEARAEADRLRVIPWIKPVVLPRTDELVLRYAETNPGWARREGFASGSEERKLLRPTEEMRVIEFLVAEWRRGKATPAYTITEIRRGLDEGFPKWLIERAGVLVTYSQMAQAEAPAETGIMRCRYCGAPYAYRENLELHERSCPKRH